MTAEYPNRTEETVTDKRVKLTDDDVRAIRRAYDNNEATQRELCDRYHVHPATVNAIVHRLARLNVPD